MPPDPALKLRCDCCGIERRFESYDEAFGAGWDCPPRFTGYVSCDLCPASLIVLGRMDEHSAAHQRWLVDGRPNDFTESYNRGDVPPIGKSG